VDLEPPSEFIVAVEHGCLARRRCPKERKDIDRALVSANRITSSIAAEALRTVAFRGGLIETPRRPRRIRGSGHGKLQAASDTLFGINLVPHFVTECRSRHVSPAGEPEKRLLAKRFQTTTAISRSGAPQAIKRDRLLATFHARRPAEIAEILDGAEVDIGRVYQLSGKISVTASRSEQQLQDGCRQWTKFGNEMMGCRPMRRCSDHLARPPRAPAGVCRQRSRIERRVRIVAQVGVGVPGSPRDLGDALVTRLHARSRCRARRTPALFSRSSSSRHPQPTSAAAIRSTIARNQQDVDARTRRARGLRQGQVAARGASGIMAIGLKPRAAGQRYRRSRDTIPNSSWLVEQERSGLYRHDLGRTTRDAMPALSACPHEGARSRSRNSQSEVKEITQKRGRACPEGIGEHAVIVGGRIEIVHRAREIEVEFASKRSTKERARESADRLDIEIESNEKVGLRRSWTFAPTKLACSAASTDT